MVSYLIELNKKIFKFFDKILCSNKIIFNFVFKIYDFLSKFTGFLTCDIRGQIILHSYVAFVTLYFYEELKAFSLSFETIGDFFSISTFLSHASLHFSYYFKVCFFLYLAFFELLFFVTFLTCLESLTNKLKEVYGPDALKKRCLNSLSKSILNGSMSFLTSFGLVGSFVLGDVIKSGYDAAVKIHEINKEVDLKDQQIAEKEKQIAIQAQQISEIVNRLDKMEAERMVARHSGNSETRTWIQSSFNYITGKK